MCSSIQFLKHSSRVISVCFPIMQEQILLNKDESEVQRILRRVEYCKKVLVDIGYSEFTWEDFLGVRTTPMVLQLSYLSSKYLYLYLYVTLWWEQAQALACRQLSTNFWAAFQVFLEQLKAVSPSPNTIRWSERTPLLRLYQSCLLPHASCFMPATQASSRSCRCSC